MFIDKIAGERITICNQVLSHVELFDLIRNSHKNYAGKLPNVLMPYWLKKLSSVLNTH